MRGRMNRRVTWNAETVRALRQRLRLTQEDFAHRLNVTVSTVSRWEKQAVEPSRLACEKLTELANGGGRGAGD